MSILRDTRRYESWLREQCDVVGTDLDRKHDRMEKNAFTFLRATYYRWANKIYSWCPELDDSPQVRIAANSRKVELGENAGAA
jgi:hypothetical protein